MYVFKIKTRMLGIRSSDKAQKLRISISSGQFDQTALLLCGLNRAKPYFKLNFTQ